MATYNPTQPPMPAACRKGPIRFVINLLGVFALSIPSIFVLGMISVLLVILTGAGGYLINFIILIGFVLLGSAARRLQIERKCRLLNYLKLATARNLPLPEFLDTLRDGEGYGVGKRAGLIADDLRLGFGLGEAMINHAPEVPLHQSAVIWRGEQAGRLCESVARVADNASAESRDTPSVRNDVALQYALVVFIALLGLSSLVGMFVLPNYVEIFEDFQADYPDITKYTWDWVAMFSPVLLLVSIVSLLGVIGWTTHGFFHTSELIVGPLRRVLEPLWWRVPVLSSAYRNRALADACFMIEQAMRSGRPLPEAIEASRHPLQSGVLDIRLQRFAQRLRQGQSLTDAAGAAKLPPLIVGMLGTASAATQPAEVFDFLCRYYTDRVSPLEAMLKAALLPFATLLAAICVAWFVFSIFYPLVVLIEASIDWTGLA